MRPGRARAAAGPDRAPAAVGPGARGQSAMVARDPYLRFFTLLGGVGNFALTGLWRTARALHGPRPRPRRRARVGFVMAAGSRRWAPRRHASPRGPRGGSGPPAHCAGSRSSADRRPCSSDSPVPARGRPGRRRFVLRGARRRGRQRRASVLPGALHPAELLARTMATSSARSTSAPCRSPALPRVGSGRGIGVRETIIAHGRHPRGRGVTRRVRRALRPRTRPADSADGDVEQRVDGHREEHAPSRR